MGRWWLLLALLASCVDSQSVTCSDGRLCPVGTACDELDGTCVQPDQLTVCIGHPDGEPCMISAPDDGICKHEICVEPRCGDELVSTGEQCDASIPADGTCVDSAYDYGVLGCDTTCSPSPDSCHRLGWHYVNVPGFGGIAAIWEDGDDVWAANQNGVLHYDGATQQWSGPTVVSGAKWWVRGIWAGAGHVFAVGSRGAMGVLAHYNGSTWSEMEVPEVLYAVWGRSASEAYAVGQGGAIYRFTTTWTKLTSSTVDDLHAVWGNGQIVAAVGDAGTVVASMAGASFQLIRGPAAGEHLRGIWGASATDVYVVGYSDGLNDPLPLLLHYDGAFTNPVLPAEVNGTLYAVTGHSAKEIYVGGDGLVLASDGATWRTMSVPTAYPLQAIHAGDKKAYAAYQSSFFIEFEGAAWVPPSSDDPTSSFEDIWTDGTELVAVGSSSVGSCSILEYSGKSSSTSSGWEDAIVPTGGSCTLVCPFLLSVWGSSKDDVYAGGPYGNFFRRVNGTWQCVSPRPLNDNTWIWAIWGSGPNDVWAAGSTTDNTTVGLAHYNGSTWTDMSSQVAAHADVIFAIWGTGPNNVYFVSKPGAIIHYDGSTFTKMQSPTPNILRTLLGSSATDIYAAGELGTILHYNGSSWSPMPLPTSTTASTSSDIRDMCARSATDIFAIGGRMLLHYNGSSWAPVTRPDGDAGNVCLASPAQLLTGGDRGAGSRLVGRLLP